MHWIILGLAVMMDLLFGEPNEAFHPVVWIGKLIDAIQSHLKKMFAYAQSKISGCILVLMVVGIAVLGGYLVTFVHGFIGLLISAYVLKSTFSITCLTNTATKICEHLEKDDLVSAKKKLPALVGRDPEGLTKEGMCSAAIESIAENFVDGILSPIFYFVLFGLPGALGYKAINTLDSMVGYKNQGGFGWASARLDDAANYIPARLSVLFITMASAFHGSSLSALRISRRDHGRTTSPNSGWPMAAMAGALSTSLKKPLCYTMGNEFALPGPQQIRGAIQIMRVSSMILIVLSFSILYYTKLPLV